MGENTALLTPARLVLEKVPRVNFYEGGARCPEDIILPSVLRAWLEYMGDQQFGCMHCRGLTPACKVRCTYSFLAGVSGAAAFLSWGEGWQGDNGALHYMSPDPDAPYRRAFDATGYSWEWVMRNETEAGERDKEAAWRAIIRQSLQAGRPVIGFGVVGPPEPALITGYDEDGDVLLGWSFFQYFPDFQGGMSTEPSGYFRKRDWFKDTDCLAVFGPRQTTQAAPDLNAQYRQGLEWMLHIMRHSIGNGRASGLAAYDAWASDVLRDDAFPPADEAALRAHYRVHDDAVGAVAEARWYGSQFLIMAAERLEPHPAADLLHAAGCYAAEHDLMWKAWGLAGGNGAPDGWQKMADPAVRAQIVAVIRESREQYAQAAAYIEHALSLPPGRD
jgi:hypothetical protein